MAVVHYQIELYDLSMIRALARDLARTAESHPISAEDPYEHERRARARIASAARALHEIASHAVLVPEDKIVQNRGRVAGTAKKGRAGGAGRPVILIEYGIQPVEGGWHPIVWERGRARYHWTKKVFDLDEALERAKKEAMELAAKYRGDWDVRVQMSRAAEKALRRK